MMGLIVACLRRGPLSKKLLQIARGHHKHQPDYEANKQRHPHHQRGRGAEVPVKASIRVALVLPEAPPMKLATGGAADGIGYRAKLDAETPEAEVVPLSERVAMGRCSAGASVLRSAGTDNLAANGAAMAPNANPIDPSGESARF